MSFLDTLIYGIREIYSDVTAMTRRSRVSFSSDFTVSDDSTNGWTRVALLGAGISLAGVCTPEQFGALGNGVADDQPAFTLAQAAIAAGTYGCLQLGAQKTYLLSTGYVPPAKSTVRGWGHSSILTFTANIGLIRIASVNDVTLQDFRIEGSFAGASQDGIRMGTSGSANTGPIRCFISNVTVYHVNRNAFSFVKNSGLASSVYTGPQLIGCNADLCTTGLSLAEQGEYLTAIGFHASQCTNGVIADAGNFTLTGGNLSGNTYGIRVTPGVNDAHSIVSNMKINHCTTRNVYVGAITNGMIFANCEIFTGKIELLTSVGVHFRGCYIDATEMIHNGCTGVLYDANIWPGASANTLTESNSPTVFWRGNVKLDGTIPDSAPDLRARQAQGAVSPTVWGFYTQSMRAIGNARVKEYADQANVQTTDGTVTTLFSWTILDEAATLAGLTVGGDQSTGANTAFYIRRLKFKRDGGTVTAGTVETTFTDEDVAGWDATIDNSTSTGRSRVTGAAATTVDWGGTTTRMEVAHA